MINEIVIFLRIGKKTLCSIDVILMMGWIWHFLLSCFQDIDSELDEKKNAYLS